MNRNERCAIDYGRMNLIQEREKRTTVRAAGDKHYNQSLIFLYRKICCIDFSISSLNSQQTVRVELDAEQ